MKETANQCGPYLPFSFTRKTPAAHRKETDGPPNQTRAEPLAGVKPLTEKTMRALAVATILLLSSSLAPSFAQDQGKSVTPSQPQSVPVQPERSPQQSQQSREEDRDRGEDRQIGRDWRARPSDSDRMGRMGQNDMGRMMDRMDRDMDSDRRIDSDRRTVGRSWRMRPDDDRGDRDRSRGYYDEDRPRHRV